jgi:hypothetical protein
MTATKNTLASQIAHKVLRGVAVIIMLGIYGAGLVGITAFTSVATSTEAAAWHRGRGHGWGRRGRGRWGRRGWGRRGWGRGRGRRGWGRRGWYGGPGFYINIR